MLNMREIRHLQNDIKWIKSRIEAIEKHIKYNDTHPNSTRHEQDLASSTSARTEKEESIKGYEQRSTKDEGRVKEDSSDKPKDGTDIRSDSA